MYMQRKMVETIIGKNQEKCKMVERENEEERENRDSEPYWGGASTNFLGELNLILMVSFFSLSAEEWVDYEEREKNNPNVKFVEAKDTISRLHDRKREINGFKVFEQRTPSKLQTKIRDCRHCRRM